MAELVVAIKGEIADECVKYNGCLAKKNDGGVFYCPLGSFYKSRQCIYQEREVGVFEPKWETIAEDCYRAMWGCKYKNKIESFK